MAEMVLVRLVFILIPYNSASHWSEFLIGENLRKTDLKNPLAMMALTGNDKLDSETYMMMNVLAGKGLNFNDPIIMAELLDGGLNENLSKAGF